MAHALHRLACFQAWLAAALAFGAQTAAAEPPRLVLPIDCAVGETCWIMAYVDHDPGDGVRDYACGIATYNEPPVNRHQGTDIALRDLGVMREGIFVRAAAAGKVLGRRDGVVDRSVRILGPESVAGRECGNGVRLDHGDGWTTQYCHLREGSVTVKAGDEVNAGAILGLVGLSGMTEHPHLHFQLEHQGRIVDPFTGPERKDQERKDQDSKDQCGAGGGGLWDATAAALMPYRPTALYNAGFAAGPPDIEAIRDGQRPPAVLKPDTPALVLWADLFNVRAGDTISFRIRDPGGDAVFEHTATVPENQVRRFVYGGLKRGAAGWAFGRYSGEVRVRRGSGPNGREEIATATTVSIQ